MSELAKSAIWAGWFANCSAAFFLLRCNIRQHIWCHSAGESAYNVILEPDVALGDVLSSCHPRHRYQDAHSVGWRRFQSVPVYAVEDSNGRHRMLKYTPEHMHCLATIHGALAPPNTGVLAIQTSTANAQVPARTHEGSCAGPLKLQPPICLPECLPACRHSSLFNMLPGSCSAALYQAWGSVNAHGMHW